MLVDDDKFMVYYLDKIFKEDGWSTIPVDHWKDVVNTAIEKQPDVIIMDINLQDDKTGYDMAYLLGSIDATKDIPIAFITADNCSTTKSEAFRCGAYDLFIKPFVKTDLLTHIRPLASLSKLSRSLRSILQ